MNVKVKLVKSNVIRQLQNLIKKLKMTSTKRIVDVKKYAFIICLSI